jgi:hypothetical protein
MVSVVYEGFCRKPQGLLRRDASSTFHASARSTFNVSKSRFHALDTSFHSHTIFTAHVQR